MNITDICLNCKKDEFYRKTIKNNTDILSLYIFKSGVIIRNNDKEDIYKKEKSFIVTDKNTSYTISATGEYLIFDKISFIISDAINFLSSFNISVNTLYSLSTTEKADITLQNMLGEFYNAQIHKNDMLKHLLGHLLANLADQIKAETFVSNCPYYDKLLEIRHDIYSRPSEKWTVDIICKQINLSRSYFQLLYREAFGITCINDVIESKISLACNLLENTSNTVSSIAKQCGYDNDVHFMRQFKKNRGCTPSEYRKKEH